MEVYEYLFPLDMDLFAKLQITQFLPVQKIIDEIWIGPTLLRRLKELNARQHALNLLQLFTYPAYESSP